MTYRDKAWLFYGALAFMLYAKGRPKPPTVPPAKPPGPSKPPGKPSHPGREGDLISYFLDPTTGLIAVKTSESPDVQWGAPELKPEKLGAYRAMLKNWTPLVDDIGIEFRVPSTEIFAVMWSESGGLPSAVSSAGARGLMQVMPANFPAGTTDAQMFDPKTNIRQGVKLMAAGRAGGTRDLVQVASWYNAGGKNGAPWTNTSWLASGRKPELTTRWGYPAQPGYIDSVVAAFNTGVKLSRVS